MPVVPVVPVVALAVREPSRLLSMRGSALFAKLEKRGPAVVEPIVPSAGSVPVRADELLEIAAVFELPPRGNERPDSEALLSLA